MDPESFFSRVGYGFCLFLEFGTDFSRISDPVFLGDRIRIWVKPTWIRNPGQGCS